MNNFFSNSYYKEIELNIFNFLNKNLDLIPKNILNSPRSIWDKIEEIIRNNIENIIIWIKDYQWEFERRAMADLAFWDENWNFYVIDVKTHNLETEFNMPNLISVQRISKFYRNDNSFFVILKVDYSISKWLIINKVEFTAIEHIDRSCLTLWALWWWQIQISNANIVRINRQQNKKDRMLFLCNKMIDSFYPNEIYKISDRIEYFRVEKSFWLEK